MRIVFSFFFGDILIYDFLFDWLITIGWDRIRRRVGQWYIVVALDFIPDPLVVGLKNFDLSNEFFDLFLVVFLLGVIQTLVEISAFFFLFEFSVQLMNFTAESVYLIVVALLHFEFRLNLVVLRGFGD
jgi:hypothetical protein